MTRNIIHSLLLGFSLLLALPAQAAIGVYEFDQPEQRDLFNLLNEELRCPMCQNQNLSDSNAPIAQDLRREVHRLITEEDADKDTVVNFMLDRYGDFVLYRPQLDRKTLLLWFGPLIILLLAIIALIRIVKNNQVKDEDLSLDQDSQQALDKLLGRGK